MKEYVAVLKNYVQFNGRAGRREYWMFVLVSFLISMALAILDGALGTKAENGSGLFGSVYSLAVLIPSLCVAIRRLHDTNRGGFWLFLLFVPVIGWIALIVFFASQGDEGENQYGPKPAPIAAA